MRSIMAGSEGKHGMLPIDLSQPHGMTCLRRQAPIRKHDAEPRRVCAQTPREGLPSDMAAYDPEAVMSFPSVVAEPV